MSHNKITFGGILQPLIESLEKNPRQSGKLSGLEVVLSRKNTEAIIALDSESNIHLLVAPAPDSEKNLAKLDLRGLKASYREWAVSGSSIKRYLDISCSTGILPAFRRPFLRFAEDVLYELCNSEMSPAEAVYKTCNRWRKFWSPDTDSDVTKEWVHGLFGELVFLANMIKQFGPHVIDSWEGPTGKDHDFQRGDELAVEIKTSVEVPFSINCNLRQLDSAIFKTLYIICYRLTPSENGRTLPDLVRNIEELILDEAWLEKFYERLIAADYSRRLEPVYNSFRFDHSDGSVFLVNDDFPKIVESSFVNPLDHRITGVRYLLQLTGLKNQKIEDTADLRILNGKSSK